MSRLYYSETGSVVPTLCEEVAAYRHARKVLWLPATREPARLFVLARSYPENSLPLRLSVNGQELPGVAPTSPDIYAWHEVAVPASLLIEGANTFQFWTDAPAMNSWSLAVEDGYREPESYVSTDGGGSWRNEHMGYLGVSRGEYVVRVRLAEGQDPEPPAVVWEDPANQRLRRLRDLVPARALQAGSTMERVQALTSWVCTQWVYRNNGTAAQYAPWDPETIIAWGQAGRGHAGQVPVVMCVHYAVTLAACCQAVGIPARCSVFMGDLNGTNGHFTAEVWFEEFGKWVMVDPTLDAMLVRDGVPLSVQEIQQAGPDLSELAQFGPGKAFQLQNPVIAAWIRDIFLPGICFHRRSLWARADFLSHPELSPAGHGSLSYCETNLIWDKNDLQAGFAMFPHYADQDYFAAPPKGLPA